MIKVYLLTENNIPVTTPDPDPDPTPPIALPKLLSPIVLFILYTCILILAVYTYRKWAQGKKTLKNPDYVGLCQFSLRGQRT